MRSQQKLPPGSVKLTAAEIWHEELWSVQKIRARWDTRPASVQSATSKKWQSDQQKFVFLFAFIQLDREAIFAEMADQFEWSYKTQEKYWSAMIKGGESIEIRITHAMRSQQRVFHFMAQEEDPKKPTIPATPQEIESACTMLPRELAIALKIAYLLGQRMRDVLNLRSNCLSTIFDPVTHANFVSATFRKTKTTRTAQPYCLHVPIEEMGQELLDLAANRQEHFLFLSDPALKDEMEKVRTLELISAALKKSNETLNVLSIRRGGLQAMAIAGMTTETLLAHSRHKRVENLHRYLDWGKVFLGAARERFAMKPMMTRAYQLGRVEGATALQATTLAEFEKLEVDGMQGTQNAGIISGRDEQL